MNILFLTDNFPPERNAPANRTWDHARHWVQSGHRVTVITTAPNFPEGKLLAGYRNRLWQRETLDGVDVIRVWSYISANEGFVRRTLDFLSFMLTGGLAALTRQRPDLLISTSPQFFCALAGWGVSRLRGWPWVFELRDLWPESIVAVGAMQRGRLFHALEWLERRMYRDADLVVAVTLGLRQDLIRRGIAPRRVQVVRNGVDTTRFAPAPPDPHLLQALGLQGQFVAGYLGTLGLGTAVESIVEAAALCRHRPDIAFVIAGSGARREAVRARITELGLTQVHLLPAQDREAMPALWSVLNVALVTMRNEPLFAGTISSKMFEAMGCGLPIVLSLPEGESTALVREAGCGLVVAPEDPQAMADAVMALADDPARTAQLSQASHTVSKRFGRDAQAACMIGLMQDMLAGRMAESEPHAFPGHPDHHP